MRTYGINENGNWVEVDETSYIWLATLAQTLRLNQGESPYYANYGIPAHTSVMTQIPPDLAVNRTQTQYAPYFASLTIIRQQNATQPTYNVYATFKNGAKIQTVVAT